MIAISVATDLNGGIGYQGRLPWQGQLPSDMRRFRELTLNQAVVMGRKTYQSLPAKFRPLPDRNNFVLSRNTAFAAQGCTVTHSLQAVLYDTVWRTGDDNVFVIGGGEIYSESFDIADRIYLTRVEAEFEADVWFPQLQSSEWELLNQMLPMPNPQDQYPCHFEVYRRRHD